MYNDTNTPEQAKAKRMIRRALELGLSVSVWDGDNEWAVRRSTDYAAILDAIGEMDIDQLSFHDTNGERIGGMLWVWGNEPDGSELAADWTVNPLLERVARA